MKKVTKADLEQREADQHRAKMDAIVVSRFQAKAAMDEEGLLDQVEDYMVGDDVSRFTRLAWEEGSFRRGSKLIQTVGEELGLSTEDIDNLFLKAKDITA